MAHHCVTLVPLFNHLPEEDQEEINHLTHHMTYEKGEIIFSPLTDAKLLIVASGSVKIYQLSNSGKEQLLRVLQPGDYTGDKDLFGSKNNNLYGETLQETTLCTITQKDFQSMLLEKPAIALKLLQLNAKKMAETEKQSQFLATDAIEERLATYLLDLSEAENSLVVELPFKMKELAAFLGTTPETLSRKMKKMSAEGYFTRSGRQITILDKEALENI